MWWFSIHEWNTFENDILYKEYVKWHGIYAKTDIIIKSLTNYAKKLLVDFSRERSCNLWHSQTGYSTVHSIFHSTTWPSKIMVIFCIEGVINFAFQFSFISASLFYYLLCNLETNSVCQSTLALSYHCLVEVASIVHNSNWLESVVFLDDRAFLSW